MQRSGRVRELEEGKKFTAVKGRQSHLRRKYV